MRARGGERVGLLPINSIVVGCIFVALQSGCGGEAGDAGSGASSGAAPPSCPAERQEEIEPIDAVSAGEVNVLSEMGGISYHAEAGRPWFGYGTVGNPDELLAKYEELVRAVLDSPGLAGFCYTQLTDVEQEINGLLTYDRRPKVDPEQVAGLHRRLFGV